MWNLCVQIREFPSLTVQGHLQGHRERITSLTFANSDQLLISASSREANVCTWDMKTRALLHTIRILGVRHVVGSPHHPFFIANGRSQLQKSYEPIIQTAFACDAERGKFLEVLGAGEAAAFAPDGYSIVTGGCRNEEALRLYDLRSTFKRLRLESDSEVLAEDRIHPIPTSHPGPQVGCPVSNLQGC